MENKQLNFTTEEINNLLDKINNGEVLTTDEKIKLKNINLSSYATKVYVDNAIANSNTGSSDTIIVEGEGDNWVSVKTFGAKGDGVTDDTNAIKAAMNSDHRFIKMDCDCYITDKITLAKHKRYKFEGSFIVRPSSFKGDAVIEINDVTDELDIDRISIFTKDFYMKNRHDISSSYSRTTFDGIVINSCRRIHIGLVQVVGLSHRAFVFNGQYECIIDSMDLWANNLTDSQCIKSSESDVIATPNGTTQHIPQDSRYTVGACFFKADCIINNAVIVGFNIGMFITEATIVNNYHPWAYKATMIYGLVVDGCYNQVNNFYIDTIGNNEDKEINFPTTLIPRKPAGIYEMKKADGHRDGYELMRNNFCNITAIKVRKNAAIAELGDDNSSSIGYMDCVSNMNPYELTASGAVIYRLHGKAKNNPNLQEPKSY